jgi:transcriptional regulator with XRE-family HTH domain
MTDNLMKREKLNQAIELAKKTRAEVAEYLGVHDRTLYRWISGETPVPKMVLLSMELLTLPR